MIEQVARTALRTVLGTVALMVIGALASALAGLAAHWLYLSAVFGWRLIAN